MADLITHESVAAELERVLSSSVFETAGRSRALLKHVVERTLSGGADQLKEFTIGAEALGKGETFDPRTDPIVRAEASRLRSRLERYFAGEGESDPITITLPKGSYIPQFAERAERASQDPALEERKASLPRRWTGWMLSAAIIALAIGAWILVRGRSRQQNGHRIAQLDVVLTSGAEIGGEVGTSIVVSPDGTRLVFVASGPDGVPHLHLRRLDQPGESELSGTEGARGPFFSPDGRWVGFWAGSRVKKLNVDGGAPVVLCDAPDLLGASWGEDGQIVASFGGNKLVRFSSSGGNASILLESAQAVEMPAWPQIVRTGKTVVFTVLGPPGANQARIEALSLETGKHTVLISGGTFGRVLAGSFLTYINQGTMYAVPFKADEARVAGSPVPVLNGVSYSPTFGYAELDSSQTGDLVFRKRVGEDVIAQWIGRTGKQETLRLKPGGYLWPRLSPDGKRLALSVMESGVPGIVVYDTVSNNLTPVPGIAERCMPLWTPNGRYLILGCGGSVLWVSTDGTSKPQALLKDQAIRVPWSFSPDGSRIAFHELGASTGLDLWTIPVHVSDHGVTAGAPEVFRQSPAFETYPAFSPDGRWVAFGSNESGTWEIYVRAFPDNGSQVRVSSGGGRIPLFSSSGHELYYRTDDQRIMLATYTTAHGSFVVQSVGQWSPARLADTGVIANLDLDSRHNRFVGLAYANESGEDANHQATFIFNFSERVRNQLSSSGR